MSGENVGGDGGNPIIEGFQTAGKNQTFAILTDNFGSLVLLTGFEKMINGSLHRPPVKVAASGLKVEAFFLLK